MGMRALFIFTGAFSRFEMDYAIIPVLAVNNN